MTRSKRVAPRMILLLSLQALRTHFERQGYRGLAQARFVDEIIFNLITERGEWL